MKKDLILLVLAITIIIHLIMLHINKSNIKENKERIEMLEKNQCEDLLKKNI